MVSKKKSNIKRRNEMRLARLMSAAEDKAGEIQAEQPEGVGVRLYSVVGDVDLSFSLWVRSIRLRFAKKKPLMNCCFGLCFPFWQFGTVNQSM